MRAAQKATVTPTLDIMGVLKLIPPNTVPLNINADVDTRAHLLEYISKTHIPTRTLRRILNNHPSTPKPSSPKGRHYPPFPVSTAVLKTKEMSRNREPI